MAVSIRSSVGEARVASPSRYFTCPRPHPTNEDVEFTSQWWIWGAMKRCDKESLTGVVVVACWLLLLSPCHGVLARESRRRNLKPRE
jgi:hypothetical protein